MRLFSAMGKDMGPCPEIGRQVQVGNNFIIVHPTSKYPTREVIHSNSDYITEVRLSQGANYTRSKASLNIEKQLSREAKVITHNRFGPIIPENKERFKSKRVAAVKVHLNKSPRIGNAYTNVN